MQYSKCQVSSGVKTRLYEYIIKQSARGLCFWFCEYLEMIRYQGSKKVPKFKYLLYIYPP